MLLLLLLGGCFDISIGGMRRELRRRRRRRSLVKLRRDLMMMGHRRCDSGRSGMMRLLEIDQHFVGSCGGRRRRWRSGRQCGWQWQ